jgi:hypothetical protein
MFQLTQEEADLMVSQNAIPSKSHLGGALPSVFTEYGTLMVASILNSDIAIQINHTIINAFVELRKQITTDPAYELLREKMKRIEAKIEAISATQKVEALLTNNKVKKLSVDVYGMSKLLDDFQDSHLIIKRPEDGEVKG